MQITMKTFVQVVQRTRLTWKHDHFVEMTDTSQTYFEFIMFKQKKS